MDRREGPGVSPRGLSVLLETIERPAVLIGTDGAVLSANERFRGLCEKHGATAVEMRALLLPDSHARLMLRLGRAHPPARESIELVLCSGEHVSARAFRPESSDGARLLLVVVDVAAGPDSSAVATLRHDIAGPLTAILGTAELALLRGGEHLGPDVHGTLLQIIDHCGRMTEILHHSRAADRNAGNGGRA